MISSKTMSSTCTASSLENFEIKEKLGKKMQIFPPLCHARQLIEPSAAHQR